MVRNLALNLNNNQLNMSYQKCIFSSISERTNDLGVGKSYS